ncbi:50S ribosomal protein L23 [Patescibacteria group bacterium]|nr:50S ribosomal protein L23 [Patescibacteria group bacterium]MBU1673646.1 50S ribosomal protein L23 [Patescibacteria group bacterium]MBU1963866.1 50S ribosomal protein L23 [Patescibacteria group bacterium]
MGLLDKFKTKTKKKEQAIAEAPQKGEQKPKAPRQARDEKVDKSKKPVIKAAKKKEDTKNAYKVLIKPLITEKATATGTYLFAVNPKTNKQEIKKAIKIVYGVSPRKVNVINSGGRQVRWGQSKGSTKAWKKAIIYLNEGDKIDTFEGV